MSPSLSAAMIRSPCIGGWLGVLLLAALGLPAVQAARRVEFPAPSGEWLIRTWESEEGLPENSATAMVQTPDHCLWFGTFNGLVRFDGRKFTVFDVSNTPGLPSSGIINLHLDRAGRMWVGTLQGLVWRVGSKWERPPGEMLGRSEMVRSFAENEAGEVLVTTFGGRLLVFGEGGLRELPAPPGVAGMGYIGGVDDQGLFWAVQHGFVGRWSGKEWERMVPDTAENRQSVARVACATAREGGIWILLRTELRRYFRGVEVARRAIPDMGSDVWSLYEDSASNIWICTTSRGVTQVPPGRPAQVWNETNGLSYHGTRFAFEDLERNLWIGTSGGGLLRFKPRRVLAFGPAQGLSERVVKTIWPAPGGGIWLGTYGHGVFRLEGQRISPVAVPAPRGLCTHVQSVLTDRRGRTWLGCFGDGLRIFDGWGWRFVPKESTAGDNIIMQFEDSRGRIWISGGHGLAMHEGGRFRSFGPETGLAALGVHGMGEDRDGVMWASNFEGVFRLLENRWSEVRQPDGKPFLEITCFHGDPDGNWWMGSLTGGLVRWRSNQVSRITGRDGLPVNGVHAILGDEQGMLWMASSQGILRVARSDLNGLKDGTSRGFKGLLLDESDGLPSVECPGGQQPVAARDARGRFWFATMKGAVMVDPARFRTNPVAPLALIEEVVFTGSAHSDGTGRPVEQRLAPPFDAGIRLPAGSHRLEVHYTAPSFVAPEKVRFRYRLEGMDDAWLEAGTRRIAYFDNLRPGRYRFHVWAANDDGLWGTGTTSLDLAVLPFFWETRAFQVAIALALAAGAAWGLRWVYRRSDRRRAAQAQFTQRLMEAQSAERARLARELHDDFTQRLARLAIDAGQAERLSTVPSEKEVLGGVRDGLIRLSEDVHALSYRLHPSILEELGLAEALRAEADRLMRQKPIVVQVKVGGIPESIPDGAALCLFRVAEEALQNVLRHAGARRVEITLRGLDGGLQLAVQDDGTGFDPDLQRRRPSLGLTGMQERVSLFRGQLDIESTPGHGTAIVAWLPLDVPRP